MGRVLWLPREGWRPADLPRLGYPVPPSRRTEAWVHHTVTLDNDSTPNVWETFDEVCRHMQRLQTIRAKDLGPDVPYNAVLFCMSSGDLIVAEGVGLYRTAKHHKGHNTVGLGFAFAGGFHLDSVPPELDAQLEIFGDWLDGLRSIGFTNLMDSKPNTADRRVFGHRDDKATECPGGHLFGRLYLI